MRDQPGQNSEGACAKALCTARYMALADPIDDIFESVYTLLGDVATTLNKPRTMTLNLAYLQSLSGWYR